MCAPQTEIYIEDRDAKDRAVCGYEGKEYPQGLIKLLEHLLHVHLYELDQPRNDKDEYGRPQILKVRRHEHPVPEYPRSRCREGHDEKYRHPHPYGGLYLVRHPHEGAEAQELYQHDIVDQYRA